uniref:NADH-cytochrome b5 reductase n=1 Tax=Phaffia rhodozyma TaxID=264483 RepID=A0A0S2RS17_PHARH|nr:cytochrome b5 reductase [Phaffia rhodozyma]
MSIFGFDPAVIISLCLGMGLSIGSIILFNYLSSEKASKTALDGTNWAQYPLIKRVDISSNTAVYRFGLPSPTAILGLPIGQHIQIQATINDKVVTRSYTPTSSDDDQGFFELLIKVYEKGNISKHIDGLKIGDSIKVKGPKGQFVYDKNLASHLSMIAGGTGITPHLQIIRAALKDETDKTTISLIYANVTEEDILLKKELDELAANSQGRFTVYYVLNNPPPGWTGGVGFITKEQIDQRLGKALEDESSKVLLCGPPPMLTAMKVHLSELGYPAPKVISKLPDKVFCF